MIATAEPIADDYLVFALMAVPVLITVALALIVAIFAVITTIIAAVTGIARLVGVFTGGRHSSQAQLVEHPSAGRSTAAASPPRRAKPAPVGPADRGARRIRHGSPQPPDTVHP